MWWMPSNRRLCVGMQNEIDFAQQAIYEKSLVWTVEMIIISESFDIPLSAYIIASEEPLLWATYSLCYLLKMSVTSYRGGNHMSLLAESLNGKIKLLGFPVS